MLFKMSYSRTLLLIITLIFSLNSNYIGTDKIVFEATGSTTVINVLRVLHFWGCLENLRPDWQKVIVLGHRASNGTEDAYTLQADLIWYFFSRRHGC
jgi:hypothetical protein